MSGSWFRATTRVFFWACAAGAASARSTAAKMRHSVLRLRLMVASLDTFGSRARSGGRILDQRSPGAQPLGGAMRTRPGGARFRRPAGLFRGDQELLRLLAQRRRQRGGTPRAEVELD